MACRLNAQFLGPRAATDNATPAPSERGFRFTAPSLELLFLVPSMQWSASHPSGLLVVQSVFESIHMNRHISSLQGDDRIMPLSFLTASGISFVDVLLNPSMNPFGAGRLR